jgi:hypothetical protein
MNPWKEKKYLPTFTLNIRSRIVRNKPTCNREKHSREKISDTSRRKSANLYICLYMYIYIPSTVRVIKSRRMRWAGNVARMWDRRGAHKVLVGKPEGKWPLGRPRRRWEDNIKTDLQEVGCGVTDWIELDQDRESWRALVNVVMNSRVP